ncbi:MAG: TRAM domain-containing protein, partial [Clostridia bacterium]|nr:TRAM domain-containing protein [Clostridia bacterium]
SLFTFIFSPRPGTKAASLPDPFDRTEKNRRFKALTDLQEQIAGRRTAAMKGERFRVLVEEPAKESGFLSGRTEGNVIIEFPGDKSLIGSFRTVEVTEPKTWVLKGKLIDDKD